MRQSPPMLLRPLATPASSPHDDKESPHRVRWGDSLSAGRPHPQPLSYEERGGRGRGSVTPLVAPDGGQVVAAQADGQLTAVVEVVAEHMHDDPLARAWAKDFALPLRQGVRLL